ncbi:MAG: hypothetical protein M3Q34_04165 [bacterium]|nr:hypothetical protein [bacterium]
MSTEAKKKMWHSLYEIFMNFQKFLVKYGIVHYKSRQEYHIGWLASGKTLEELRLHLHSEWGFGNHFVSWIDNGQVLSWRRLVDPKNQYHLRVFYDGEIRGHLEPTPESGIFNHILKKGMKEAQTDFLKFLGEFVVHEQVISELKVDPTVYNPSSEIVIEDKAVTPKN